MSNRTACAPTLTPTLSRKREREENNAPKNSQPLSRRSEAPVQLRSAGDSIRGSPEVRRTKASQPLIPQNPFDQATATDLDTGATVAGSGSSTPKLAACAIGQ